MKQQELENEIALLKAQPTPDQAIKAYTHWLFNAHSEFVEQVWRNNPLMAQHFRSKLTGLINRMENGEYMSTKVLATFDRQLSDTYRADLYKYIIENHLNAW